MKPKIIKSSQVVCEAPAIECSCGGSCFGSDTGSTYNYSESKYYCEVCDLEWVLPKNVTMVVKFKKVVINE